MSTPTSTSAAGAERPPGSQDEVGPNAPDPSEPPNAADESEWFSAASGGRKRSTVLIMMLLIGLVAGGAVSVLAGRFAGPPAADVQAAPSERDPSASEGGEAAGVDPPQPAPAQPEVTPVQRWRPTDNEVYPNAKRLASRVVERLTEFDSGAVARDVAAAAARRFDVATPKLLDAAEELVRPGVRSTGLVVYPQLGGIRPDSASVMVVVDQTLDDGSRSWVERRTVDVRLELRGQEWALDEVGSGGGAVVERPAQLSEAALEVLEHPSIQLTESARWDIYSGTVDDGLLAMMARAAERHEIAVVTIATGHPENVFATDITSNHTLGRAVDIFSVDGQPVVESQKKGSAAFRLARWLYNRGVPELGSPWAFDGYGGRSFTDVVHADHIHFAM